VHFLQQALLRNEFVDRLSDFNPGGRANARFHQTSTLPRTIISNVNAIKATAVTPKNMQIMKMVSSMLVFPCKLRVVFFTLNAPKRLSGKLPRPA
jgi:hypothetical protein